MITINKVDYRMLLYHQRAQFHFQILITSLRVKHRVQTGVVNADFQ